MSDWIPVPEPMTWQLPGPLTHNGMSYASVTLRAPSAADILKATAIPGAVGMDITLRLIEVVSAEHVPYDVLKTMPAYLIMQMSDYLDEFAGTPAPDPLEAWRAARRKAAREAAAPAPEPNAAAPVAPAGS